MAIYSIIHKAFIQFDCDDYEKAEKIVDKAFELEYTYEDMNIGASAGGPAFGPYIVIESEHKHDVVKIVNQIQSYMRRFKGLTIIC